jgi:DNA invertase Pin-like site-specific DNA recombinase
MDNLARVDTHERRITLIPANPSLSQSGTSGAAALLRVAAYCRVSTDDDEQLTSYKNQILHYTDIISSNANWTMAGIFADEGITGTSTKKRVEFQKLMELCRRGKVDLILTKSISRFSRNTLDSISYVRKLKSWGVGVIFQKENINTLHMSGEMVFTVLSAFAQAESESISENVKWGKRNSYKNGKIPFQYGRLLGYEKGDDGRPRIAEDQAVAVRKIFSMFLAGYSITRIKDGLEAESVPSASGKPEWSQSVIRYILSNEKYIGDVLLQKTYVEDCISKRIVKNNGIVPQYYVSNNHDPIIPRDTFYKVQEELARRSSKRGVAEKNVKTNRGKYSAKYALTECLTCGECGTRYRRVTWARGGKKKIVWRCISRLEHGTAYCKSSPSIEEDRLHTAVLEATRRLAIDKDELIAALKEDIEYAADPGKDSIDRAFAEQRIRELDAEMMAFIDRIGSTAEPVCFEAIEKIAEEKKMLTTRPAEDDPHKPTGKAADAKLTDLADIIEAYAFNLDDYSDELTYRIVEDVRVLDQENLLVRFYGGVEQVM